MQPVPLFPQREVLLQGADEPHFGDGPRPQLVHEGPCLGERVPRQFLETFQQAPRLARITIKGDPGRPGQ